MSRIHSYPLSGRGYVNIGRSKPVVAVGEPKILGNNFYVQVISRLSSDVFPATVANRRKSGVVASKKRHGRISRDKVTQRNTPGKRSVKYYGKIHYGFSELRVTELRSLSPELDQMLSSGTYVYVDGHICLNRPEAFIHTSTGLHLSPLARQNPRKYMASAKYQYAKEESQARKGNGCYSKRGRNKTLPIGMVLIRATGELMLDTIPDDVIDSYMHDDLSLSKASLGEALKECMDIAKIKIDKLSELTFIPLRTLQNYIYGETQPSKENLIAICIALQLNYDASGAILKAAGIALPDQGVNKLYDLLLRQQCKDVATANKFLVQHGYKPLTIPEED